MATRIPKINVMEEEFARLLKWHNLAFEREFRFHPTRKWRTDFLVMHRFYDEVPDEHVEKRAYGLLVEIEGIVWQGPAGRHQRAKGFANDCEKYAEALVEGWMVLRVTPDMVKDGRAIRYVKKYFELEPSSSALPSQASPPPAERTAGG